MSNYIVGNKYEEMVRLTAQRRMPWVRVAEIMANVTKTARGYQAVVPMCKLAAIDDTTDLGLGGAADTEISVDSRDVAIPLRVLGKRYMTFDSTASLRETVPDRSLMDRVRTMASVAAGSVDALAYGAVSAVSLANANFAHELGPRGTEPNKYYVPIEDGLIHIGPGAASLSSVGGLAGAVTGKTITAQALRLMVQKLYNANVEPVGYLDAGDANTFLYFAILTDSQMMDLRAETGDNSIVSANKFVSSSNRVIAGTWQIFENLILLTSTRAKELVDVADPGTDFYAHRAVIFGRNYLGFAATPADELPASAPQIERIGVFEDLDAPDVGDSGMVPPQPRIFEVRQVPAGDPQGKLSNVSWYAHVGAKLLDPQRGVQLITRATND